MKAERKFSAKAWRGIRVVPALISGRPSRTRSAADLAVNALKRVGRTGG